MIIVRLTNGFGNNLFQYIAARLLSEFHNHELTVIPPSSDYYAIQDLKNVGVDFKETSFRGDVIIINEDNYQKAFDKSLKHYNFIVQGYFEDHTFFNQKINLIKSWFPKIQKRKDDDLVIHFRAGDRLFYKNEFDYKPRVERYLKAIEKFNFSSLHIVTDMLEWDYLTEEKLQKMSFHVDVPHKDRVPLKESIDYFNSFVEKFEKFNPIVEKRAVSEDFNFIRSFNNILFEHGTLGWWASVLSDAEKVGVYGPWRPWKGASNKNLSNVNINGWFKWE